MVAELSGSHRKQRQLRCCAVACMMGGRSRDATIGAAIEIAWRRKLMTTY